MARPPLTGATSLSDELQLTCWVRVRTVPSLNEPLAVNCSPSPAAMLALPGDIVIESSVASVTTSELVPTTPAKRALMDAFPGVIPVANPSEPDALLMLATADGDAVQATDDVMSCEPSGKFPVATNWDTMPTGTWGFVVVTVIELGADDSTSTLAVPLTDPWLAVMVAGPVDWPVARPAELMLTTLGAEEFQVTALVRV